MSQLLVIVDQVIDVDIAVVSLEEGVLPQLVSGGALEAVKGPPGGLSFH